jgi:hypothetical protein
MTEGIDSAIVLRSAMRTGLFSAASLGLLFLLTPPLSAIAPLPLRLADPKLPLQELRPLDRHVWVLSLEGTWTQPALPGMAYHINLIFANGQSYSHRVLDDSFRLGQVRCLIPEYQLVRNGLARGGRFTIVVSAGHPVATVTAAEVVSAPFEVRWPLERPIYRWAPQTRFTPPAPIDAFPPPNAGVPAPTPGKEPIPGGEPPAVPK